MAQSENDQSSDKLNSHETITGRSVFLVETTAAGISVQTALLSSDSQLLRAPAVFPDVDYAFSQIDELKRLVSRHFSEAARVGAQVLAAQQSSSQKPAGPGLQSTSTDTDTDTDTAKIPPAPRVAKTKKAQPARTLFK